MFSFFDPFAPTVITHRNLPHWEQPGVCYFLTFRTADSLPTELLRDFNMERGYWLEAHGIDPTSDDWHLHIAGLPEADRKSYNERFSSLIQKNLDAGHGECLLQTNEVRSIVAECFHHFDGVRYVLGDFVIMPNHVHLLVQFVGSGRLKRQMYAWKRFTARQINKHLNRTGHFWQGESYDHIVRSEAQWMAYRRYIADNPLKAKLDEGCFTHHRCSWEPQP